MIWDKYQIKHNIDYNLHIFWLQNNVHLLDSLAAQLLIPDHCSHIQKVFPDILIELLYRCQSQASPEDIGCTLARLISADRSSKEIVCWAEGFFTKEDTASLLERFHTKCIEQPPAKRSKKNSITSKDVEVLRSAHTLLCVDPDLYGSLWDWSCLSHILGAPSTACVRTQDGNTLRWSVLIHKYIDLIYFS